MALAMMAALYRTGNRPGLLDRFIAGRGRIYLTGASILDHSANGRRWARYGNRSPYKPPRRTAPTGRGRRPVDRHLRVQRRAVVGRGARAWQA